MGLKTEIELAMLNFATDYHRFESIREDIAFKGIKSHPVFRNKILAKIREVVEGAELTDEEICKNCGCLEYKNTTWSGWCNEGKCSKLEHGKVVVQDQLQAILKAMGD